MFRLFINLFLGIKKPFLFFLAFRFLSLLFHVKGVALIIAYINLLLGKGSPIVLLDYFFVHYTGAFVYVFPLVAGSIICLGGIVAYCARMVAVKMMISQELQSLDNVLRAIGSIDFIPGDAQLTEAEMLRVVSRDVRYYARLLASIMEVFVPLIIIFVALCFLGYLQPVLTLIVLVSMGAYGLVLYRISKKTSQMTRDINRTSPEDLGERRGLVKDVLTGVYGDFCRKDRVDRTHSRIDSFLKLYSSRLSVNDKTMVCTFVFLSFLITAVVLYVGVQIHHGNNPLFHGVLFIVVLNASLFQLRGVTTASTKIRVYQPHAIAYLNTMKQLKRASRESQTSAKIKIVADESKLSGISEDMELTSGSVLGIVYPGLKKLDKLVIGKVFRQIGLTRPPSFFLVTDDRDTVWKKLRTIPIDDELLGSIPLELREKININRIMELHDSKQETISKDCFNSIDPLYRAVLQVSDVQENQIVILNSSLFSGLSGTQLIHLKNRLKNNTLLIVYDKHPETSTFGELVVVCKSENLQSDKVDQEDDMFLVDEL